MNEKGIKKNRESAIKLFDHAPMKKTFGMELSYNEQGNAIFHMPYNDKFNHAFGSVHGGVLSTLLDNAGWFTAGPYYNTWISTIDLQVQFLRPTSNSDLISIGEIVKCGKTLAFTRMKLLDSNEKLIATGSATFSVTDKEIDLSSFQ